MQRVVRSLGAVAGALACTRVHQAFSDPVATWIERPGSKVSIGATCRDRAGRDQPADLTLNDHNIDGRLVFDRRGQSSFQRSCDQIDIRVTPDRVVLTAQCRTRNQRVQSTTIEVQNIHNIDGRLVRGSAPAAVVVPSPATIRDGRDRDPEEPGVSRLGAGRPRRFQDALRLVHDESSVLGAGCGGEHSPLGFGVCQQRAVAGRNVEEVRRRAGALQSALPNDDSLRRARDV
jgi:hypothetical protein